MKHGTFTSPPPLSLYWSQMYESIRICERTERHVLASPRAIFIPLRFSSRRLLWAGMDTACWITSGPVFVSPSPVALRSPPRLKHNTKTKHWRKLWHFEFLQLLISCRHMPDSRENKHSCLSLDVPQMIFVHSLEPQMPISRGLRNQAHMRV